MTCVTQPECAFHEWLPFGDHIDTRVHVWLPNSNPLFGSDAQAPQSPSKGRPTKMRQTPRTRTILSIVISAGLALAAATPGVAAAADGFGDVEPDAYYSNAVAWMVAEDITSGIEAGCFGPTLDVTRGQVAAFLHRLEESTATSSPAETHPFVDVTASYQQQPVGWLFGAGLTTGVSATRFAPDAPITRGDFAVLLWRYAGSPTIGSIDPFVDVTRNYQRAAIAWMAHELITTGTTATTFDPEGLVDRGQAATFLYRYVDPGDVEPLGTTAPCTFELRLALEAGGLTTPEAICAAPWVARFEIDYLLAVVEDREDASLDLIIAAAAVGAECLTPERVADLSRLFL